ncbi:hypothetical protein C0Q70_03269 [Pomacea canaliculata]|uniref:Uncharacterized protein n=1 Tax=Pomacea canaliculata TaxID=400727 RepID=A0A2T7PS91_POMCA|nr:hypothetical protein C0Q70_03269 [Pomacea canaliculata]
MGQGGKIMTVNGSDDGNNDDTNDDKSDNKRSPRQKNVYDAEDSRCRGRPELLGGQLFIHHGLLSLAA